MIIKKSLKSKRKGIKIGKEVQVQVRQVFSLLLFPYIRKISEREKKRSLVACGAAGPSTRCAVCLWP
jgi:hypothetical protein